MSVYDMMLENWENRRNTFFDFLGVPPKYGLSQVQVLDKAYYDWFPRPDDGG